MAEKVKVSRELGLALDELLGGRELSDDKKSQLIYMRVHKQFLETSLAWGIRNNPLNKVGTMKFARILDNGYEYEKTPEELIADAYKNIMKSLDHCASDFESGYGKGIRFTLDMLNIEIKGMND